MLVPPPEVCRILVTADVEITSDRCENKLHALLILFAQTIFKAGFIPKKILILKYLLSKV